MGWGGATLFRMTSRHPPSRTPWGTSPARSGGRARRALSRYSAAFPHAYTHAAHSTIKVSAERSMRPEVIPIDEALVEMM
jgi:hypothetical protein